MSRLFLKADIIKVYTRKLNVEMLTLYIYKVDVSQLRQ